ncbi:MAG: DUF4259 domain-containing protein [Oscillospiraceae bacterium]|nr:DUF4259 domain-containing protein [Oscillospiraceae bacterium]
MGCWGITAFESDTGLDAAGAVRDILPQDGNLKLKVLIKAMHTKDWGVPDVADAHSHSSPMAVTEIIAKFLDGDAGGLDYDEDWAAEHNKFRDIITFSADKESIGWLRDYLSDTVKYAKENAEYGHKWNGWFKEKDWLGWQEHMSELTERLDGLLALPEDPIELVQQQEQTQSTGMNFS